MGHVRGCKGYLRVVSFSGPKPSPCKLIYLVSHRASSRARKQFDVLGQLSSQSNHTRQISATQAEAHQASITDFTTSVLSSHASSSTSYTTMHNATTESVNAIIGRTERFLADEIAEDVPTGVTPRKRVWEITNHWERTQPREALIAALHNNRQIDTQHSAPVSPVLPSGGSEISLSSLGAAWEVQSLAPVSMTSEVISLSTSQMRAPRSKIGGLTMANGAGKLGGVNEKEKDRERERIALAPLGEAGGNIPRRTRK
jgi:kinesin family protein 11